VVFINQLREKVGVMFGNPEVTPGGRALKFYATMRLDVRKIENIKQGQDSIGARTRVRVVKNKLAPPFKQAEFDIIYGQGISREGCLLDVGVANSLITRTGTWYAFGEVRLGQGKEAARAYLKEHPELASEIEKRIREFLQSGTVKAESAPAEVETEV
jgi:recombination protein RecA